MRKPSYFVASSLVFAGFASMAGCSSGGGSTASSQPSAAQATQFCMSLCAKENSCDTTGTQQDCAQTCASDDAGASSVPAGCDENKLLTEGNACIAGTCAQLGTCFLQAVADTGCLTSTSTGTTIGTTTSTSVGTSTSTGTTTTMTPASCSDCAKAQPCCAALDAAENVGDGGECSIFSESACNAMTGADQASSAAACQDVLALGKSADVAACM